MKKKQEFDDIVIYQKKDRQGYVVFGAKVYRSGQLVNLIGTWQSNRNACNGAAAWARNRGQYVEVKKEPPEEMGPSLDSHAGDQIYSGME